MPNSVTFDLKSMEVGDAIDYRLDNGKFVLSTISAIKDSFIQIAYEQTHCAWCDIKNESDRLARAQSVSRQPSHRLQHLQLHDFVDVRQPFVVPLYEYSAWKYGQIIEFDAHSGQVRVRLFYDGSEAWTHLDNDAEIAPFRSKPRSKLNTPHPQTLQRSQRIVREFLKNKTQEGDGERTLTRIPMEIAEEITKFYHHSTTLPAFTSYKVGDDLEYAVSELLSVRCRIVAKRGALLVLTDTDDKLAVPDHFEISLLDDSHKLIIKMRDQTRMRDEFERLAWSLQPISDGGGVYGCFEHELYGEFGSLARKLSDSMRRQCHRYISDHLSFFEALPPWKMAIIALCEVHNVRVRVFEFDAAYNELFMSFEYGVCAETEQMPMLMLLEHDDYYHVLRSPKLRYARPLRGSYKGNASIYDLRERLSF